MELHNLFPFAGVYRNSSISYLTISNPIRAIDLGIDFPTEIGLIEMNNILIAIHS